MKLLLLLAAAAPVFAASPVTVTIGGLNAQVFYSGFVAGSIAGLTQINAFVPSGLTTGGQLPIVVSIGGVQSQAGFLAGQSRLKGGCSEDSLRHKINASFLHGRGFTFVLRIDNLNKESLCVLLRCSCWELF